MRWTLNTCPQGSPDTPRQSPPRQNRTCRQRTPCTCRQPGRNSRYCTGNPPARPSPRGTRRRSGSLGSRCSWHICLPRTACTTARCRRCCRCRCPHSPLGMSSLTPGCLRPESWSWPGRRCTLRPRHLLCISPLCIVCVHVNGLRGTVRALEGKGKWAEASAGQHAACALALDRLRLREASAAGRATRLWRRASGLGQIPARRAGAAAWAGVPCPQGTRLEPARCAQPPLH